jgi:hypothetical protein
LGAERIDIPEIFSLLEKNSKKNIWAQERKLNMDNKNQLRAG